jgi:hypothetical protein
VTWEGLTPPYRTIVADPPWHYDAMPVGGARPGTFGATRRLAYGTMALDEIKALPVAEKAADDAVLWLWTTNRWLPYSFQVIEAWGFDYRQTIVWGKNNPMAGGWKFWNIARPLSWRPSLVYSIFILKQRAIFAQRVFEKSLWGERLQSCFL